MGLPGRCDTLWNTVWDAELVQDSGNEIEFTHRHASAEHEYVVGLQMKLQPAAELGHVIQQMIVGDSLESVPAQCRDDGVRIGATYLMRENGLAGLDQLVAC